MAVYLHYIKLKMNEQEVLCNYKHNVNVLSTFRMGVNKLYISKYN